MHRALLLIGCAGLFGCSAVVSPDESRLGGDPDVDAGRPAPMLMDSGPDRPDTGMVDGCEDRPRCGEGDVLLTCTGGRPSEVSCPAANAFCEDGECVERRCTPGRRCVEGGSAVCDARGTGVTFTECGAAGCDDATGACREDEPPPSCEGAREIEVGGDDTVDLCDRDDDRRYVPGGDCGMGQADTGDQLYVFTLESPRTVFIQATDVDGGAAIDTVIYLRRDCDDAGSQIACGDDVPCDAASLPDGSVRCIRGQELRQSRIRAELDAGTYYLVVDAHDYTADRVNYDCGQVRVEIGAEGG